MLYRDVNIVLRYTFCSELYKTATFEAVSQEFVSRVPWCKVDVLIRQCKLVGRGQFVCS